MGKMSCIGVKLSALAICQKHGPATQASPVLATKLSKITLHCAPEACHAACGAGIGGVRAMQLIQKHGSLEAVMSQLDTARYGVPDPFPFSEARVLFKGE